MTRDEINEFERLAALLAGAYAEMQGLAKKNPNDGVNPFKLRLVNSLLISLNRVFGPHLKPVEGFDTFDTDTVPTASDVLFVLSQYVEGLEHVRSQNVAVGLGGRWYWKVDGATSDLRT